MDGQRSKPGPHLGTSCAMRFTHRCHGTCLSQCRPVHMTSAGTPGRASGYSCLHPKVIAQEDAFLAPFWFNSQLSECYLFIFSILQGKGSKLIKGFTHFSHSGMRSLAFNVEEEGWELSVSTRKESPEETNSLPSLQESRNNTKVFGLFCLQAVRAA